MFLYFDFTHHVLYTLLHTFGGICTAFLDGSALLFSG